GCRQRWKRTSQRGCCCWRSSIAASNVATVTTKNTRSIANTTWQNRRKSPESDPIPPTAVGGSFRYGLQQGSAPSPVFSLPRGAREREEKNGNPTCAPCVGGT